MTKKNILHLAVKSYSGNYLDEEKVTQISSLLRRSDLKAYIACLKTLENAKKVTVISSANVDKELFENLFPAKKIVIEYDPKLILGVRVIDRDMVYEFSLKNSLDNVLTNIDKNYD